MGAYATTTAVQTKLIGMNFDAVTTSLAALCILDAERAIDGVLIRRYDIAAFHTTTAVPPLCSSMAENLAVGFVLKHSSRGGKESEARAKALIDSVVGEDGQLEQISKYKVSLFETSFARIADKSLTASRVMSDSDQYTKTFDEDDPKDWAIDTEKLDDISDGRV